MDSMLSYPETRLRDSGLFDFLVDLVGVDTIFDLVLELLICFLEVSIRPSPRLQAGRSCSQTPFPADDLRKAVLLTWAEPLSYKSTRQCPSLLLRRGSAGTSVF